MVSCMYATNAIVENELYPLHKGCNTQSLLFHETLKYDNYILCIGYSPSIIAYCPRMRFLLPSTMLLPCSAKYMRCSRILGTRFALWYNNTNEIAYAYPLNVATINRVIVVMICQMTLSWAPWPGIAIYGGGERVRYIIDDAYCCNACHKRPKVGSQRWQIGWAEMRSTHVCVLSSTPQSIPSIHSWREWAVNWKNWQVASQDSTLHFEYCFM